jgi:hypothetical protein
MTLPDGRSGCPSPAGGDREPERVQVRFTVVVRQAAGVVLVALLVGACGSTSSSGAVPSPRPPGTAITDGFVVAPGSKLVGPVFSYPWTETRDATSRAILTVDRDPVQVYDEYVAQARRQGILIRGSGTTDVDGLDTCTLLGADGSPVRPTSPTPPGSAKATTPPARVGRDTDAPTPTFTAAPLTFPGSGAAARLTCVGGGRRAGADPPVTAGVQMSWGGSSHHVVVSVGPNVVLRLNDLGDERATPPTHLPKVADADLATAPGESFGQRNDAFEDGYRRLSLVSGSQVAAEVGGFTVLHVDGDARAVMEGYAAQLGKGGHVPAVLEQPTTRGKVLTVANSPSGGGSAYLLTDPSRRWILVETSSD